MLTIIKNSFVISVLTLPVLTGCFTQSHSGDLRDKGSKMSSSQNLNLVASADSVENAYANNIVWAVNFGGNRYQASSGVTFESDQLSHKFLLGNVDNILGSQDPTLYQTYIEGNISINHAVANGTYDVTFLFAEPEDIATGERIFDVNINDEKVLSAIDIRGMRDGKAFSALDKTVNNIKVDNGNLFIDLVPIKGSPVLSGIIVRNHDENTKQWQLVWQDEFDYEGQPDPTKWSFDEWPARKVNDEDQVYTSREKNVRVNGRKLIIEAHKEPYDNGEYTSARIHTLGKADLLYGKIDVKAKLPAGRGTWAAIWMLPSDPFRYATSCQAGVDWQGSSTCDAWPNSGEIDIMEHVGFDMHNVHGTVHNKAYYWINWEQRKGAINARNADQEFHVYSVEWSPQQIVVLMDGTPYFSYSNEQTGWQAWPFDHPYHLILNLAIGGMWGRAGGPIDDSIFPVRMEIDYVRMYTNR